MSRSSSWTRSKSNRIYLKIYLKLSKFEYLLIIKLSFLVDFILFFPYRGNLNFYISAVILNLSKINLMYWSNEVQDWEYQLFSQNKEEFELGLSHTNSFHFDSLHSHQSIICRSFEKDSYTQEIFDEENKSDNDIIDLLKLKDTHCLGMQLLSLNHF